MRVLEKILTVVILLALIMKFNLISGGDVIALWTMLILACLYYPFGFLFFNQIRLRHIFKKVAYKNVTASRIILAIATGLGLSTIVVGLLFKLLNFSGANGMLLSGLIVTAIAFVISLILLLKNNETNAKFSLWRLGIIGLIGIFLFFTSEFSIVKFQYRNHPKYVEAYAKYLTDPRNEELYKKVELERNRIRLTDEEFKKYEESVSDKAPD
jgi:hypothetical protein